MSRYSEQIKEILDKYYNCDNSDCGKGAICNYCSLRKDIEALLQDGEWKCPECNGSGLKFPSTFGKYYKCKNCNGTGLKEGGGR